MNDIGCQLDVGEINCRLDGSLDLVNNCENSLEKVKASLQEGTEAKIMEDDARMKVTQTSAEANTTKRKEIEGDREEKKAKKEEERLKREEERTLRDQERRRRDDERKAEKLRKAEEKKMKEIEKLKKEDERKQREAEKKKREEDRRRKNEERNLRELEKRKKEEAKRKEQEEKEVERLNLKKREDEKRKKQVSVMAKFLSLSEKSQSKIHEVTPNVASSELPHSSRNYRDDKAKVEPLFLPPPERPQFFVLRPLDDEIDEALKNGVEIEARNLLQSYLDSWKCSRLSKRRAKPSRWGAKHKQEFSLLENSVFDTTVCEDGNSDCEIIDHSKEANSIGSPKMSSEIDFIKNSIPDLAGKRCLFKFHDNYRPAFYGVFMKKSAFIKPRRPFVQDPELDYDYDSDDDWEEEEPGETLSDTDKEDDKSEKEDDENSDGFFVPDGYLSEDEGLNEIKNLDDNETREVAKGCTPALSAGLESRKSILLIEKLVGKALKSNVPFVLSELRDCSDSREGENEQNMEEPGKCGSSKGRKSFFAGDSSLLRNFRTEILLESVTFKMADLEEVEDVGFMKEVKKKAKTEGKFPANLLPTLVKGVHSLPVGMKKLIELLAPQFSDVPKIQIEIAIRKISDFDGSKWRVKDSILDEFGMASETGFISKDKMAATTNEISKFLGKNPKPLIRRIAPTSVMAESVKREEEVISLKDEE